MLVTIRHALYGTVLFYIHLHTVCSAAPLVSFYSIDDAYFHASAARLPCVCVKIFLTASPPSPIPPYTQEAELTLKAADLARAQQQVSDLSRKLTVAEQGIVAAEGKAASLQENVRNMESQVRLAVDAWGGKRDGET